MSVNAETLYLCSLGVDTVPPLGKGVRLKVFHFCKLCRTKKSELFAQNSFVQSLIFLFKIYSKLNYAKIICR